MRYFIFIGIYLHITSLKSKKDPKINPILHGGGGDIYAPPNTYRQISYAAWELVKVGWVVDFLLRFRLKNGCIFISMK